MNPFEFSGASNLTKEQIIALFIKDYNYSRFIQSKRNVFMWGERGSGKTMTFLYNKINMLDRLFNESDSSNLIPVYISCITPLFYKREYLLLKNDYKASLISEHYLVLSIAKSLACTLKEIEHMFSTEELDDLLEEIDYILGDELPNSGSVFKRVESYVRRELIKTQSHINKPDSDSFWENTHSFSSLVLQILELIFQCQSFKNCHFVFMLDDAHDLNNFQREQVNSWIAYRDNSKFSFKISAAKLTDYDLNTSSGGAILEGHDYLSIDLEKPYQNDTSSFGQLARKILERRIEMLGLSCSAEEFFPISESFQAGLKRSEEEARAIATKKYGKNATSKQINDYVYKYGRAIYFRGLASTKANRPKYSGLDNIIHTSTGVIRNLLEPCYWMFEDVLSKCESEEKIHYIDPKFQTDVILKRSDKLWEWIKDGIDKDIQDCSREDGKKIHNLFDNLAIYFRNRLLDENCSEPRSVTFSISEQGHENYSKVVKILDLARRAQLLYKRQGSGKDDGARVEYFVPNRLLWPGRSLDPKGQAGAVSIKCSSLFGAINGKKIPYKKETDKNLTSDMQGDLFSGS